MFGFPQHVGSDGSEDNTGLRNVRDPFREDCLYFVNSSSRIFIRRSYDFNSSLETSIKGRVLGSFSATFGSYFEPLFLVSWYEFLNYLERIFMVSIILH